MTACLTCSGIQPPTTNERCAACLDFERRLEEYLSRGGSPAEHIVSVTVNHITARRRAPLTLHDDKDEEYETFSMGEIYCLPHDVLKQTVEDTVLVQSSREGIELCSDVVVLTPTQARVLVEILERSIAKATQLGAPP